MPEANSAPILSQLVSQSPRVKPGAATKPKLLDRLRDALRSCRSFATHLMWLQRTVVHASKIARPPAADPQPRSA
jgi:hypothetical protein